MIKYLSLSWRFRTSTPFLNRSFSLSSNSWWEQFQKRYPVQTIETLKAQNCLNIPQNDISPSIFQIDRFFAVKENGVQVLKLYQNKYRKDLLTIILSKILADDQKLPFNMMGPRGVGKSHLLALLVLYMRWEKILTPNKVSFLYINDPCLYFQNFPKFIKQDVEYFLCEELANEKEVIIRKKFENVDWRDPSSVKSFLSETLKELRDRGKRPLLIMDQYNILERYKDRDRIIYQFLMNLRLIFFMNYLIGASNNNGSMKEMNSLIADQIYLPSTKMFASHEEAKEYLTHLGYFLEALSVQADVNGNLSKIEEYTRFNLLELMKLNQIFKITENTKIDENLMEIYYHRRRDEIDLSHKKFIQEFLQTDYRKQDFLELLTYLDKDEPVDDTKLYLFERADFNLMDIDPERKTIYSITPIAKNYLDATYQFNLLSQDHALTLAKFHFKRYEESKGGLKGDHFQECVKYILINNTKDLKDVFYHEEKLCYFEPNYFYSVQADLKSDISKRRNFFFVPTMKNFPVCDFIHFNDKQKTIRLINCTICSNTLGTLQKKANELAENFKRLFKQAENKNDASNIGKLKKLLDDIRTESEEKILLKLCLIVDHNETTTGDGIEYVNIKNNQLWKRVYEYDS